MPLLLGAKSLPSIFSRRPRLFKTRRGPIFFHILLNFGENSSGGLGPPIFFLGGLKVEGALSLPRGGEDV